MILSMVGVGTLPLLLAMVISYLQGTKSLQNVIGASFQALATETATKIDFIMKEEIKRNIRLASHPTLVLTVRERYRQISEFNDTELAKQFGNQAELWKSKEPGQKSLLNNSGSRILKSFLKRDPLSEESTHALFVTDSKGVLLSSANNYPEFFNGSKPFVSKTVQGGKGFIYVGPIMPISGSEDFGFHLAVPILNHSKQVLGILHRVYRAKPFFSSSIERIIFGETGHVMLIDSQRAEELHHVADHAGDGVEVAGRRAGAGQADVEAALVEYELLGTLLELAAALLDALLDALLGGVRGLSHPAARGRVEASDRAQPLGDRALAAQVAGSHLGERMGRDGRSDLGAGPALQLLEALGPRRHAGWRA